MSSPFENRTTSGFDLSIGTGIALETVLEPVAQVYDPERQVPKKVSLSNYDEFWINIDTLLRNLMGSIPSEQQRSVTPGQVYPFLVEEMATIIALVRNEYGQQVDVVFYQNKLLGLESAHPYAVLKVATTEKQLDAKENETYIGKHLQKNKPDLVRFFNRELKPSSKSRTLLITHRPYDLLSYRKFGDLDLLESHTGNVRQRATWYTKIGSKKDLVQIPFYACFLQLFGDGQTFSPMPRAAQQLILGLAEKYKWHAMTTSDRIRFGFDTLADRHLATVMTKMLGEEIR